LLLADILPTGYFAAKQAWEHPNVSAMLKQIRDCPDEPKIQLAIHFAILGLGPVGMVSPHFHWSRETLHPEIDHEWDTT
jgi:hypothetical protein